MADYDSDSSLDSSGDIRTQVLLGYASATPTSDEFSQIGGHPTWLDPSILPSADLAKCGICHKFMSLLLQLNADLPEQFPGHERRLYLWTCRSKTCRRKEGGVRGFRGVKVSGSGEVKVQKEVVLKEEEKEKKEETKERVGERLFGVKASTTTGSNPFSSNPFASTGASTGSSNPFATVSSPLNATSAHKPTPPPPQEEVASSSSSSLPETFASKARIYSPQPQASTSTKPSEPWPQPSSFPTPYPSSHLDAGAEYIDPTPVPAAPSHVRIDDSAEGGMGVKDAFESSMDKTFQKFADRLSQNPEQVLRYEYAGMPLLYSKTDAVGKLLSPDTQGKVGVKGPPRCASCGSERTFELQLTPRLIEEVEREDMSLDGMDWGTILLATCGRDCGEGVEFKEEWVGVQWEESATHKRPT